MYERQQLRLACIAVCRGTSTGSALDGMVYCCSAVHTDGHPSTLLPECSPGSACASCGQLHTSQAAAVVLSRLLRPEAA